MKLREGSLSYWLLMALEKTTDGVLSLDEFSYSAQMRAIKGIPSKPHHKALVMAIRRLRTKGIISYDTEQDKKIVLRLTSVGQDFLNKGSKTEWNGKYLVAIWDIPETKRIVRNLLRRRLKEWGFKNLQKSVWVSKRNVEQQLRALISELGIGKWVAVIESEDSSLRVLFGDSEA